MQLMVCCSVTRKLIQNKLFVGIALTLNIKEGITEIDDNNRKTENQEDENLNFVA